MRNFSIDLIWAKIQIAITAIGGWLGYFLGGIDGLMIALMIFMGLDYVTGVMCAIIDKKLSSAVGFKGICKKVLILFMVGIANIVDLHVIGSGSALRGAVIAFGGRSINEEQPKYLNSQTTPIYNKSQHLYGLDLAGEAIRSRGHRSVKSTGASSSRSSLNESSDSSL